jgi:hypothetical protein
MVLICGKPAACVGDMAVCTGPPDTIAPPGCPTVLIGGGGGGGAAKAGSKGQGSAKTEAPPVGEGHYLDVTFQDKGGKPITGVAYIMKAPDNTISEGTLAGQIKQGGVPKGNYEITIYAITKVQWSVKKASVGDKVKLLAETSGVDSGTKATLDIFIKDTNFADYQIESFETTVNGGKIEKEWEMKLGGPFSEDQMRKDEIGLYSYPMFYFNVKVGKLGARSGILEYKDYLELKFKDDKGKPIANRKFRVIFPNGVIKEGKLDGSGYAKISDIPPGRAKVVLDPRRT